MNLSKNELKNINGGGISAWGILGIGALVVFIAGAIDGFARPFSCHK